MSTKLGDFDRAEREFAPYVEAGRKITLIAGVLRTSQYNYTATKSSLD